MLRRAYVPRRKPGKMFQPAMAGKDMLRTSDLRELRKACRVRHGEYWHSAANMLGSVIRQQRATPRQADWIASLTEAIRKPENPYHTVVDDDAVPAPVLSGKRSSTVCSLR